MIIGYARVSTTEQNLGLRHDELKPAFDGTKRHRKTLQVQLFCNLKTTRRVCVIPGYRPSSSLTSWPQQIAEDLQAAMELFAGTANELRED